MPTMNVKVGSGLGVGLGAGVASGVGTGIAVSDFRTRRPDCATIASAHIVTSASARLTLRVDETCRAPIDSCFPQKPEIGREGICICNAARILLATVRAASITSRSALIVLELGIMPRFRG